MPKLDRTEQRIVGVLIEKQLSVPDTYPLSENALEAGCNQKNNREPVMDLVDFQIAGALMSLQEKGFVVRVEGGGRVAKFKHRAVEELQIDQKELAVVAELLLRGPQAPGALKPRVARLGCHLTPEEIEAMLRQLAARKPAMVELMPLAARERDRRWRHLLGDGTEMHGVSAAAASVAVGGPAGGGAAAGGPAAVARPAAAGPAAAAAAAVRPERAPVADAARLLELERRLASIEHLLPGLQQQVAALQNALDSLRSREHDE